MKTAMDYVKERDERVDVAGKTARLKEWCEKFFDDKNWVDSGGDIRLEPFHRDSGVWVRVLLTATRAIFEIAYAVSGDVESNTIYRYWSDSDAEEMPALIEEAWKSAVCSTTFLKQIYYSDRIPVHPVAGIADIVGSAAE